MNRNEENIQTLLRGGEKPASLKLQEEREKRNRKLQKEIMSENFTNLETYLEIQNQEANRSLHNFYPKQCKISKTMFYNIPYYKTVSNQR